MAGRSASPLPQDAIVAQMAAYAKAAAVTLADVSGAQKDRALSRIRRVLADRRARILEANARDEACALQMAADGELCADLIPSLRLAPVYDEMLASIARLEELSDPVGPAAAVQEEALNDGTSVIRVLRPLGVLLVLYESHPALTAQLACLAVKSGNAILLKGGREAHHTNLALYESVHFALSTYDADAGPSKAMQTSGARVPPAAVQLVPAREDPVTLLHLEKYIDLFVPRVNQRLALHLAAASKVPVLLPPAGACHYYVDEGMRPETVVRLVSDAASVFDARIGGLVLRILFHDSVLPTVVPIVASSLTNRGIALVCDSQTQSHLHGLDERQRALVHAPVSGSHEPLESIPVFLSNAVLLGSVDTFEHAMHRINAQGARHADAILSGSAARCKVFASRVESAIVLVNASLCLAASTSHPCGGVLGFGASRGSSASATLSRGPLTLSRLSVPRYRIIGALGSSE